MYLKKLSASGFCQALCRAYLSYLLFGVISGLSSKTLHALCGFLGLTEAASQCTELLDVSVGVEWMIPHARGCAQLWWEDLKRPGGATKAVSSNFQS